MRKVSFVPDGWRSRRGIASFATFALLVLGLPGTSVGQSAQPTIAFLNPSTFATADERGIVVSDAAPEEGPGCCSGTSAGYHLSAWVSNAPPGARVFFSVTQPPLDIEITDVQASSATTWESYWRIPTEIIDGPATVRAYLVVDDVPVAMAEQAITILRVQENAQIKYPATSGPFGTFAPLADALVGGAPTTRTAPVGVIDAFYTLGADASRVRAFYSTSPSGTPPVWRVCGTELVGTSTTRAGNGVRCTLDPADAQESVTAVATVVNDGPDDAPYDARFNQSGDAVAVGTPYAQQPTSMAFVTSGSQRRDRHADTKIFSCSAAETVRLSDQLGRHIAGANLDVHAEGPTDGLKLNADSLSLWTDVKTPDRGTHASEPAYDCATHPANSDPGTQAEHPRFGANDRKHLESHNPGTTDLGTFDVRMRSSVEGITNYTIWTDEQDDGCGANDDTFSDGELAVSGAIGWGEPAPEPIELPREATASCSAPSPGPSESPSTPPSEPPPPPEPEPTESPSTPPTDPPAFEQRLTLRTVVDDARPRLVRFKGALTSTTGSCIANRSIVLKSRRIGGTFVSVQSGTTTSTGKWLMERTVKRTREWRAVAKRLGTCPGVKSRIVRLKVARR